MRTLLLLFVIILVSASAEEQQPRRHLRVGRELAPCNSKHPRWPRCKNDPSPDDAEPSVDVDNIPPATIEIVEAPDSPEETNLDRLKAYKRKKKLEKLQAQQNRDSNNLYKKKKQQKKDAKLKQQLAQDKKAHDLMKQKAQNTANQNPDSQYVKDRKKHIREDEDKRYNQEKNGIDKRWEPETARKRKKKQQRDALSNLNQIMDEALEVDKELKKLNHMGHRFGQAGIYHAPDPRYYKEKELKERKAQLAKDMGEARGRIIGPLSGTRNGGATAGSKETDMKNLKVQHAARIKQRDNKIQDHLKQESAKIDAGINAYLKEVNPAEKVKASLTDALKKKFAGKK